MARLHTVRAIGAAALAAGLTFAALPGAAIAQDNDHHHHHGDDDQQRPPAGGPGGGGFQGQRPPPPPPAGPGPGPAAAPGGEGRARYVQQQQQQRQPPGTLQQRPFEPGRREGGQRRFAGDDQPGAARNGDRDRRDAPPNWQGGDRPPPPPARGAGGWRGDDGRRGGEAWRGGDRSPPPPPPPNGGRDWRGGDPRYAGRQRDWDRGWRGSQRYDWRGYRNYHRDVFRVGRYYAPYRGWSYRRLGIGFYLQPLFFGSSYWIGDPFYYRLPPAYGPYRWVRYYGDALLVNIYTGQVVDVIYDIFW